MTEGVIAEMQRSGRGKGHMGTWDPWVHILDFYSAGRTHEPYSHRFGGRTHQLLSDGEWRMFLLLEWARDICDAREQYPLPREITMEVAHDLGIKHQYYPGTRVPFVMSLDFVVDRITNGQTFPEAINIKTEAELDDEDVINELEIARATCEGMGIPHHLVIAERLKESQKIKNIEWIRDAQLDEYATEPFPGFYEQHMTRMVSDLRARRPDSSLSDYCSNYDRRYSVEKGTGMRVARMLLQSRALTMDLNNKNPQMAHMSSYQLSARAGQLHAMGGL